MTALLLTVVLAAVKPAAGPPLRLHVEPAKPKLGDTVSVFVERTDGAAVPTVALGERRFPAFDLGGGRYRALVPLSPLDRPGTHRLVVECGARKGTATVTVGRRPFGIQRIWLRGVATDLDVVERARVGEVKDLATADKRWKGAFLRPASGRVSSPFGVRRYRNGVFLTDYYHRGIDYAPGAGAPVLAPADGRVVLVGLEREGFRVHGNTVGIDHGHGVISLMLHLARAVVKEGDEVRAGDAVGLVGGTGAVTAPHLHWGLYVNGVAVDPAPWLAGSIE